MRDLGKMGESVLSLWTGQAGITCNRAEEDKGGWDFLLQFPLPPVPNGVLALDRVPPPTSCLVQVKATDSADAPDVKLSNWKRFCEPSFPCFFLLLNFAGNDLPLDAHLVHVDQSWVAKALRRLRELPLSAGDELHKHSMAVRASDRDRLTSLGGDALAAAIRQAIGIDPLAYLDAKRSWWSSVGFEHSARFQFTLKTLALGETSADELLADFAIGLRKELPSKLTALDESRFGILKPLRPDLPMDVVATIADLKPLASVMLTLRTDTRRAHIQADLFSSRAMFPFLAPEFDKLRFSSKYFDMIIRQSEATWRISLSTLDFQQEAPLSELARLGDLILLFRDLGSKATNLEVDVRSKGSPNAHFAGRVSSPLVELDQDLIAFAEAATNAALVASHFQLQPDLVVRPHDLLSWHNQLAALGAVLRIERESLIISGEVNDDCPDDAELATGLVAGVFLGKTLVVVAAAIHGRAKFNPSTTEARKTFVIPAPSVDVVHHVVIEDGSVGSHSTEPFFTRIRTWIEHKGYINMLPDSSESPLST